MHVTDIEILSWYESTNPIHNKPMLFPVLFENEKAFAYKLTGQNIKQKITKSSRPLIAELSSGEGVLFHSTKEKQTKEIKTGEYLYIDPDTSFYFTVSKSAEINMILFEIK